MTDTPAPTAPPRRLARSTDDRVIAGVCGGLADYTGIDPIVFRIGFAVATLAGGGGLLAYVLAWVLIAEEGEPAHEWASPAVMVAIVAIAVMVGLPTLFLSIIFGHGLPLVPIVIVAVILLSPRRRLWPGTWRCRHA